MPNSISYDFSCLLFTLGCLPLLFLSALPSNLIWYLCLIFLILTYIFFYLVRIFKFISLIFIGIGFLWSTHHAQEYLQLVSHYIDKNINIRAEVVSLNSQNNFIEESSKNVTFNITHVNQKAIDYPLPIVLVWNNKELPFAGQIWDMSVKTKVVHSYLNEGGFDSQRFAIANRKLLTGSIKQAELIENTINSRQFIVNLILPYINLFDFSDIFWALAFGDRSHLTQEHKTVMFETGIAHLMAISGMHILLVAYIVNRTMRFLQILLPINIISHWQPLILGWFITVMYAWLTGLNPPALRAILALTLWLFFRYRNYQITSWQMINRIIAILLIIDPFMILSESFWLSCYAVVCLTFIAHWFPIKYFRQKRYYLFQLVRLQLLLTFLLLPIQLFIFNGISSVSIIANLIAIPIISFVTFPAILFMIICDLLHCHYLIIWFGFIAEQSLYYLFIILKQIKSYWITFEHSYYLLSISGWLILIIWRLSLWRYYYITILLMLLILITPTLKRNQPNWQIDMLDVGHGLVVVIRQGKTAILYDTGAKWQNSSAAERIVIPFLRWHGLNVEGIIISHEHNDHIGGLSILQQYYPNAWLISSTQRLNNDYLCKAGEELIWNDLKLLFLWPNDIDNQAFNAESCVVKVSDDQFSLLLTGDLERQQEEQLVLKYRKLLFSTILQIPHHGSNTSSSYAFLNYVKPTVSLGSVSRYNPWKLPSNKVLQRYQTLNLNYKLTSVTGQISIRFYQNDWFIMGFRTELKPRWYHDWFGSFTNNR